MWTLQVVKEQPNKNTMVTRIFYKGDEHGRVKVEQYTQSRFKGSIILDYTEEYETIPIHMIHQNELQNPHQDNSMYSSDTTPRTDGVIVEIATSSESNDLEIKEFLTEKEKKGEYKV